MVQPNTHARNPIVIDPQNYIFITKRKDKKRKVWWQKLKRED